VLEAFEDFQSGRFGRIPALHLPQAAVSF
jgi:hypothetical protein